MKYLFTLLSVLLSLSMSFGQADFYKHYTHSHADTLRGMLRPERTCFDVTFYDLFLHVIPDSKSFEGYNVIEYDVVEDFEVLQIDLFDEIKISSIVSNEEELTFEREHDAVFVKFPSTQKKGTKGSIKVYYSGVPQVAKNPPWDGGFVWKKDEQGKPWIGVACEGDGASLWWPNKDHLSDEPDSMRISVQTMYDLMVVSNGDLRSKESKGDGVNVYEWFVSYPINNYNVTINIGDYVHFKDTYTSKTDGETLKCDYYVLKENEAAARKHFKQVIPTLEAFEHYFGKYPFWEDGFGMVETPYLGMEHQGAIAYGNEYKNGYLGTGGMNTKKVKADYIIVHETGHEYFGNSISCNDLAEMWIHESFTTYMESLFIEYHYDYKTAIEYLYGQSKYVLNREPIIGPFDVNWEDWKGSDHYYKGACILNTLRHAVDNDELWFETLKALHEEHRITHMTSEQIFDFFNERLGKNYDAFFEQYLKYAAIPKVEFAIKEKKKGLKVKYRMTADVDGFSMPMKLGKLWNYTTVQPTSEWQEVYIPNVSKDDFRIATELFLVKTKQFKY